LIGKKHDDGMKSFILDTPLPRAVELEGDPVS
jgi:hypothetical protein